MSHLKIDRLIMITVIVSLTFAIGIQLEGKVKELEIQLRQPFANGMTFGTVGSYEVIKGRLHYEIDPTDPANQAVVQLA
ncbi:MAG: hypothetical protein GY940_37690 [bacterium]|nr:hypothetical protein [bacterium]